MDDRADTVHVSLRAVAAAQTPLVQGALFAVGLLTDLFARRTPRLLLFGVLIGATGFTLSPVFTRISVRCMGDHAVARS